jgi:hypothetical protein
MTCPPGGAESSPVFGHRLTATRPYTVAVDYGDGTRYRTDDQYLDAAFAHAYRSPGAFTVTATLRDATGRTATSSCVYTWAAPAVPPPVATASQAPGPASAPTPAPFAHPGGLCPLEGAPGVLADGTPVVCAPTPADPQPRWRPA